MKPKMRQTAKIDVRPEQMRRWKDTGEAFLILTVQELSPSSSFYLITYLQDQQQVVSYLPHFITGKSEIIYELTDNSFFDPTKQENT